MEAEDQYLSHYLNVFEGSPSHNDNFNSIFQQNPHDDNEEEGFHVHDHYQYHHHHHHHQPMDQEKMLRRMVSNRESARRSRMREKNRIKKLQIQAEQLMASNQFLANKVNSYLEYNNQILQENSQLKERVSFFHQYIFDGKPDDIIRKHHQ